jgi:hypothetical protein
MHAGKGRSTSAVWQKRFLIIAKMQPFACEYDIFLKRERLLLCALLPESMGAEEEHSKERGDFIIWYSHASPYHDNVVTIFPLLNCMMKF